MSNLAVKEVEFNGDVLLAAQEKTSEKIFVTVTEVCEGIGLTKKQRDRQVSNIQKDIVLSKGVENLPLKFGGQVRNVVVVELDFLPLWLAKISITPKMKENNPEMVEKLVDYQLKAKDVLANAFVHDVTQIIPQNYKEALLQIVENLEIIEELKPKAEIHDQLVASVNDTDIIMIAKNIGVGEKKLFEFLRATEVLFKQGQDNVPYQQYQNNEYFEVKTMVRLDKYNREYRYYTTKVTGKGKVFITKLVDKYGGAKVINDLKMKEIKEHVETINKELN